MQRKVCRVTVAGFAIIPDGAPAFRWSHCTSSVSRRISRAAGRWRRSGRLRRRNRMIRPRAYMGWMAAGTLVLCTAAQSAENAPLVQRSVRVKAEVQHDTSIPLRQMPPALRAQGQRVHPVLPLPRHGGGGVTAADPVLQSLIAQPLAPALTLNFDGVGNGFSGPAGTFTVAGAPPDTNGSVGPNHYVQIVNADFAVFDKSGAALFGPVPINTLWSGFGGDCETNNDGDPVVEYRKLADRWVIAQPSFSTAPYLECVAVSTTADPTGPYNRYSFSYTDFPDYPKIGVRRRGLCLRPSEHVGGPSGHATVLQCGHELRRSAARRPRRRKTATGRIAELRGFTRRGRRAARLLAVPCRLDYPTEHDLDWSDHAHDRRVHSALQRYGRHVCRSERDQAATGYAR